jgi:glycosyltransferase involved in cell wall biosynthesis
LHGEYHFDVAHQLTYVGFRFPGHLWKLGIPFVWGPIGGLANTPWNLLPLLGPAGALYYGGRNAINSLQKRFLPSPRAAFRSAAAVIAATSEMRDEIRKWYGVESDVICEVGPPPVPQWPGARRQPGDPLIIAWSGLHLPGKALPLLLDALARVGGRFPWELHILGDGPCRAAWTRHAERLGLADRCHWHGSLPRDRALRVMADAHLFAITSLKDLTSTVLLEALSLGLPVVAPDHCGFRDVITGECGIKIPLGGRRAIAAGFADAIATLHADEARRRTMADAARRRAADFSWESKAARLEAIDARVLERDAVRRPVPLAPSLAGTD